LLPRFASQINRVGVDSRTNGDDGPADIFEIGPADNVSDKRQKGNFSVHDG